MLFPKRKRLIVAEYENGENWWASFVFKYSTAQSNHSIPSKPNYIVRKDLLLIMSGGFNARDLALLLPDEVDVVSLQYITSSSSKSKAHSSKDASTFQPLVPKIDVSKKVTRYFPEKAPMWTEKKEREKEEGEEESVSFSLDREGTNAKPVEDRRLARLAQTSSSSSSQRRKRYEAEVIAELGKDETNASPSVGALEDHSLGKEEEDLALREEEDAAAQRARIKKAVLQKEKEKESEVAIERKKEIPTANEEEESEYETDSDESEDEEEEERVLLRPVFIPRHRRETILEAEKKAAEEEALLEKKKLKELERKKQTRVMVAESMQRMEEKKQLDMTDADSDAGLPDDTDDKDNDEEEVKK